MTKQDKQDLTNVLSTFEGICKRRHNKQGFRVCRGCPFYKSSFRACSFYSILDGFKTYGINLMMIKYNEDPTMPKRRKK